MSIEVLEILFRGSTVIRSTLHVSKVIAEYIRYTHFLLQENSDYLTNSLHLSGHRSVDFSSCTDWAVTVAPSPPAVTDYSRDRWKAGEMVYSRVS